MVLGKVISLHQGYEDDSKASTQRPKSPPVGELSILLENQHLYFNPFFEGATFQVVQHVDNSSVVLLSCFIYNSEIGYELPELSSGDYYLYVFFGDTYYWGCITM